jgi:hypothetical protein
MKKPLPTAVWEDYQAWGLYGSTEHRWVFNKLEVALRGGLHAGPAAVPPSHSGLYISRPVYNLYGMGIGAEQFSYQTHQHDEMVRHSIVPPGHFWCEWIVGEHISIDYQKYDDDTWEAVAVWSGNHYTDSNLTKFRSWTRLSNRAAPSVYDLPINLEWVFEPGVSFFNIEMRGEHIIEIHLRPGHTEFMDLPVGTSLFPVWDDGGVLPHGEWIPDNDPSMAEFKAYGHLKEIRDGFIIVRDAHQD